MLIRIRPDQSRLGMFVHGFDGSWLLHPFWRPRFVVRTESDLARLREADVPAIVIDLSQGVGPEPEDGVPAATPASMPYAAAADPPAVRSRMPAPGGCRPDAGHGAKAVVGRSKRAVKLLYDGARLGRAVRSAEVRAVVDDIAAAMERDAHDLIRITRLKTKDEYTYLHSVAVCALMINLARHMGLEDGLVRDLGLAGLLHDIGKMAVPDAVLNKPGGLDEGEFAIVRGHPAAGHRMLMEGEGISEVALDVCLHHHEKIDGTGYPDRLAGEAISLPARMGAICDVYDALTSNRAYKAAWSPTQAIAAMAGWAGQFDRALLLRFMQSILVFPPGMLVRLRSNRLGVVLPPARKGRAPKVLAIFSIAERAMMPAEEVALGHTLAHDQIVSEEDPACWPIEGWPAILARVAQDMAADA